MAGEDRYEVLSIVDHRVNPKTLTAEFLVKWVGYPNPEDDTWEPLDNIYLEVELLMKMEKKKHSQLLAPLKGRVPDEAAKAPKDLPKCKVLDSKILNKMKDPMEWLPTGSETIARMDFEKISDMGVLLWEVKFKGDKKFYFIRKSVVAYYWPVAAALFLTKMARENEAIANDPRFQ